MNARSPRSTVAAMAAGGLLTVGAGGLALWFLVGAHAATTDHSAAAGYGVSAVGRIPGTTSPTTAPNTGSSTGSGSATGATSSAEKVPSSKHDASGKGALPPVGTWARGLLHGTVVVAKGSGSQTLVVQRGRVTAATATTVTVASSDGYTLVWTVPANRRGSAGEYRSAGSARTFPVGTDVEAIGTPSGRGTALAMAIRPWPHGKPIRPTLPPQPIAPTRPTVTPPIHILPTRTGGPITAGPVPVDPPITIDPPVTAW